MTVIECVLPSNDVKLFVLRLVGFVIGWVLMNTFIRTLNKKK